MDIQTSNTMHSIVKSSNDRKEYRVIKLENGLTALLISDKHFMCDGKNVQFPLSPSAVHGDNTTSGDETSDDSASEGSDGEMESGEEMEPQQHENRNKMAAAALCVKVGSFGDPDYMQGLAHFLEHMIFMGTTKYPEENYFDSFICKHGGSTNAFTDCERTVFKMDVRPKYFCDALDIFASCFSSPLLKPDSMDKEIEAVESEFQLNYPLDSARKAILLGSMAKKDHPMSNFFWGNIKSLREIPKEKHIDIYEQLCEFRKRYYSAHYMTLAVCSTETLEDLETWVQRAFSRIPNNGLPSPSYKTLKDPFKTDRFHKLYKVIPVKKTHQVIIHWALPSLEEHYRVKPLGYLGWIIGNEGKGSILAYLRKNSLALSLAAGNDESGFEFNSTCSLFNICIKLTEKGMDNVFEVICMVFQYIKMLQKAGPEEKLYKELKDIEDNMFKFQEPVDESDYVEQIAECMQCYPAEHFLVGGKLFFDYNEQLIKSCQEALNIENANIMILSSRFSKEMCKEVEPWTSASYSISDIPEEWKQCFKDLDVHPEFSLPHVNNFIATKFNLKSEISSGSQYPIKILEDEQSCIWYKKDTKFKVPKAYIYCHLISPISRSSARNAAMLDLFVGILIQELSEVAYPAEVAGLSYNVYACETGLGLYASGFDHKLPVLFETLLDYIVNFKLTNDVFEVMKTQTLKLYYNTFIKPGKLCKDVRLAILQKVHWSTVDKKLALKDVTPEMFMKFIKECFSKIFVEFLVQGNITIEETLSLNSLVKDKLKPTPLATKEFLELGAMKFSEGETICQVSTFNTKDQTSVVLNYYQLIPGSIKTSACMDLLMAHMNEPCFNVLRTQKQLGYDVSCMATATHGILGFLISVKSSSDKFSLSEIDDNIEDFLESFSSVIENLNEEDFKTQLAAIIDVKRCEDLNLQEEARRNWFEILWFNYCFDRLQKEIECLQNLSLDQFKSWSLDVLKKDKNLRKKLGVQVDGSCVKCSEKSSVHILDDAKNNYEINDVVDSDHDEDKIIHRLNFLIPENGDKSRNFISDIKAYKNNLSAYPMWKITS